MPEVRPLWSEKAQSSLNRLSVEKGFLGGYGYCDQEVFRT